MTKPFGKILEKQAACRERQAALQTLQRRRMQIERALQKAKQFTVAGALRRAKR
jgi:hypothetical protein